MTITLHDGDLPANLDLGAVVAVDSETMGLRPERDRLCLVPVSYTHLTLPTKVTV